MGSTKARTSARARMFSRSMVLKRKKDQIFYDPKNATYIQSFDGYRAFRRISTIEEDVLKRKNEEIFSKN